MSLRITADQEAKVHALRGELAITTYIGNLLDDHLHSPLERAIRDCHEYCAQRGVTPEMLLDKATKTK